MENCFKKYKVDLVQLGAAFLAGVLVYLPMLGDRLGNPDTVWNSTLVKDDFGWEGCLGRFGLGWVAAAKGGLVLPCLTTLFCLAAAALAGVLICRLFGIQSPVGRGLAAAAVLLSPQFADCLTYYYCSDGYLIACLLAVAAALLLVAPGWKKPLLGGVCVMLSLCLYQAYAALTICLVLFRCLLALLEQEPKPVLLTGVKACVGIGGGTAAYLALFKALQIAGVVGTTDDRGFDSIGQLPGLAILKNTYLETIRYYFTSNLLNNRWMNRDILNLALFGLAALVYLLLLAKRKNPAAFGLAALLALAAPVGLMFTLILAPQVSIYDTTGLLMLPQMMSLYLFAAAIACRCGKRPLRAALCLLLALALWVQLLWVGTFQQCMELNRRQADSLAQQVAEQVQPLMAQGGTAMLIVGSPYEGNYPLLNTGLYTVVHGSIAPYGMFWEDSVGANATWQMYLREYLCVDVPVPGTETQLRMRDLPEVQEMPLFPAPGSVEMIESVVVVRFS